MATDGFPLFSKRFLFFWVMLLIGGVSLPYLVGNEQQIVAQYLKSFPNSYAPLHEARPFLIGLVCVLPAIGALAYSLSGILDRYLIRKFFSIFMMCLCGFILIWLMFDVQNNLDDFGNLAENWKLAGEYYLIQLPYLLVLMTPFVLLLSALFVLGQLSTHRELVSIIQTGRGFGRVVAPMIGFGVFISIFLMVLNFHWAAWGEAYKGGLKDAAEHGALTRARSVVSSHATTGRLWYVGLFPQEYYEGEALRNVEITIPTEDKTPDKRLRIDKASWDNETGDWTFIGVEELQIAGVEIPKFHPKQEEVVMKGWVETPSQLISPGLEADSLGLPELEDWLRSQAGLTWADRQPYLTQWHARFSKPWTCLVAVLLAIPLGVVFSRRGALGGVITAIVLCLLLFSASEIMLTMGDGGYLRPWIAAWGANIMFTLVALVLLMRRVQNRPIYQTLKSWFNLLGGKA